MTHQGEMLRDTIDLTALSYGVRKSDILGTSRSRELVQARREIWKHLREQGWSYPRIGRAFNRDHTTILHGVRAK